MPETKKGINRNKVNAFGKKNKFNGFGQFKNKTVRTEGNKVITKNTTFEVENEDEISEELRQYFEDEAVKEYAQSSIDAKPVTQTPWTAQRDNRFDEGFIKRLGSLKPEEAKAFDANEVSWVHPLLAVTSRQGASTVYQKNDLNKTLYVINVADELNTPADYKIPVNIDLDTRTTKLALDTLAEIIHNHISRGKQVVVHCALGVERSALTVVHFLTQYLYYPTLDEAYEHVSSIRPIVADRRSWAGLNNSGYINRKVGR